MGPAGTGLAGRLEAVRRRIEAASGDPGAVRIVAVTKGFGADAVAAALAAGLTDVGENYADELVAKAGALADGAGGGLPAPVWHYLGAVQRNKVARLAPLVSWWQAVSRVEEGRAIAGATRGRRSWSRSTWPGSRDGAAARPTGCRSWSPPCATRTSVWPA